MLSSINQYLETLFGYRLTSAAYLNKTHRRLKQLSRRRISFRDKKGIDSTIRILLRSGIQNLQLYNYGVLTRPSLESPRWTLFPTHNSGLFSCLTTTIWTLSEAMHSGICCTRINNKFGMHEFKRNWNRDEWSYLFRQPGKTEAEELSLSPQRAHGYFDQHGDYTRIVTQERSVAWFGKLLSTYFHPSDEVRDRARFFIEKYAISPDHTIAVCYRGTDKHTEITPTPLSQYFDYVDQEIAKTQNSRVLIQTDQLQVRDLFLARYKQNCSFINELPATSGNTVLHYTNLRGDPRDFAINLYAMTLALANTKQLITHTGNVGFFLSLHRILQSKNLIQLQ
jgi:hypothetical protein